MSTTTSTRVPAVALFMAPYAAVALVHVFALALGESEVADFTKPLLMPVLLAGVIAALPQLRSIATLLIVLALVFSWLGDTSLLYSGDLGFLIGLGFFLLAHLAYIALFAFRMRRRSVPRAAVVGYALWWLLLMVMLVPHTGPLLVPVTVYGVALAAMGAMASACGAWIGAGGALFIVSDSLLGLGHFLPGFSPWQLDLLIMLSYLTAQGLIAWGVVRSVRYR